MAKPVTEEELQLRKRARRRLIGAIALVAVVAAVLPMVLDTDPKPTSSEVNIQIPPPDAKMAPPGTADKPAKAGAAKAQAKMEPAKEEKADTAPVAAKPPLEEASPVAVKTEEKATAKSAEKIAEKVAEKAVKPGAGTFYIQVAALAEADKARAVQQQITGAGVRAYTETVTTGGVKMTRVRAGPFATRDEAERARGQLAMIGLDGRVAGN
jgi:DedD protein